MNDLLTTDELAEKLKLKATTIRRWKRRGRIPAIKLSRKVVRYDLEAVLDALNDKRVDRKEAGDE